MPRYTYNVKCEECGEMCSSEKSLNKHIMECHDGREYHEKFNRPKLKNSIYCEECGKQVTCNHGLVLHVAKLHHDSEQYFLNYINKDPNAGICKNSHCDNHTTFRGLLYGGDRYEFGYGYDNYCCIECAHSDMNGKFNQPQHGYQLRSMTAEQTAKEILNNRDFYNRKRVKYLPESEYLVCIELMKRDINFQWQKSFGRYNADLYFDNLRMVVELHENNHKYNKYAAKDKKRKETILSMPENKDLKWVKIPIYDDSITTDDIVDKIVNIIC